jgi:hypothetical protein
VARPGGRIRPEAGQLLSLLFQPPSLAGCFVRHRCEATWSGRGTCAFPQRTGYAREHRVLERRHATSSLRHDVVHVERGFLADLRDPTVLAPLARPEPRSALQRDGDVSGGHPSAGLLFDERSSRRCPDGPRETRLAARSGEHRQTVAPHGRDRRIAVSGVWSLSWVALPGSCCCCAHAVSRS